jgi:hypothetical protein
MRITLTTDIHRPKRLTPPLVNRVSVATLPNPKLGQRTHNLRQQTASLWERTTTVTQQWFRYQCLQHHDHLMLIGDFFGLVRGWPPNVERVKRVTAHYRVFQKR